MLNRSVYNPTVAELIPDTLAQLHEWDGEGVPDPSVLKSMAIDLKRLQNERNAGKLADEINRRLPGSSSAVKASARRLAEVSDEDSPRTARSSSSTATRNGRARSSGRRSRWSGRSTPSTIS